MTVGEGGQALRPWLVTRALPFAMKNDPMRSLGDLGSLRPASGDTVTIDGETTAFGPVAPKWIDRNGVLRLNSVVTTAKSTFLTFTILDVPQRTVVRIDVPFTGSGRVQAVLNGVRVDHKQIVELDKGLYPMLVAARLRTGWHSLKAAFQPVTGEEIAAARDYTRKIGGIPSEADRQATVVRLMRAEMIRKATDVPEAKRKHMLWIADEEQADAWLKLHGIHKDR